MPSAIAWNPVTCPSTRQGVSSCPLTISPGQDAGGVSGVWPRVTTRSGAESATFGAAMTTRPASRQAAAISAQRRPKVVLASACGIDQANTGSSPRLRRQSWRPRPSDAPLRSLLHDPGQAARPRQIGLRRPMDPAASQDDFIPAGLAAFGIEADEIELAVINAAHQLFWPPILELLSIDTSAVPVERNPDLSQAPPSR